MLVPSDVRTKIGKVDGQFDGRRRGRFAVLVIGGDGYLGWPQAMHLSQLDYRVGVVDSLFRRRWDLECGTESLIPIYPLAQRIRVWRELTGRTIEMFVGDIVDFAFIYKVIRRFRPDAIVHFGEQRSAPYSMIDREHAVFTQVNNLVGTLNLLYAVKRICPGSHLVKLGTMGEYGTPNIDIEEGFLTVVHNGRSDVLPFPKQAGSFYHLSKVHDSDNILFACRTWKLRATDLNQGVVYGIDTECTRLDPRLATRFDYDGIWGTVLNRFCVEAAIAQPLTVYGKGGQTRGFLDIRDTMECIHLSLQNPAEPGEYRVFNQFTEQFSVAQLAQLVKQQATKKGWIVRIENIEDPRVEAQEHHYRAAHTRLLDLGLHPHYLSDALVNSLLDVVAKFSKRVRKATLVPYIKWDRTHNRASYATAANKIARVAPIPLG